MKLSFVTNDKTVKIKSILVGKRLKQRLEEIGIITGNTVTVL